MSSLDNYSLNTNLVEEKLEDSSTDSIESEEDRAPVKKIGSLVQISEATKKGKGPPIGMPAQGRTKVFPRQDTAYLKFESIPFDEHRSLVWRERPAFKQSEKIKEWVAFALIGPLVGSVAFVMIEVEDILVIKIREYTNYLIYDAIENDIIRVFVPWLFFAGISSLLGLIAALITTYYGPAASGSGVAELIGYVNGVNYPDFLSVPTLLTKIIGVTLGVSGRLCVGKEGPLAHIGAVLGACILYVPGLNFDFLKNDEFKRAFVAAGASAGVSVAFGAPIGGTLFVYELSRPTTFWKFTMLWKTFLSCSLSVFVMAILLSIKEGEFNNFSPSRVKFGLIKDAEEDISAFFLLGNAISLGFIGGIMGPIFIMVNTWANNVRKKVLTRSWLKPIETALFCFLTASLFYFVPYFMKHCVYSDAIPVSFQESYRTWCPQDDPERGIHFNPVASVFWATEGETIKNMMNVNVNMSIKDLFIFVGIWYALTCVTYGTNVPAGLFLPGMIIGSAIGSIYFEFYDDYTDKVPKESAGRQQLRKDFIVLAISAVLGGYTRMTYSLSVIMMETSQSLNIFVPIIITILVSNQVGFIFTRSLYQRAVRAKQMPILMQSVPGPCKGMIAEQLMTSEVVTMKTTEEVGDVYEKLLLANHHNFPVLNRRGALVGIIPRNFILILLKNHCFYKEECKNESAKLNESSSALLSETVIENKKRQSQMQEVNLMLKSKLSKRMDEAGGKNLTQLRRARSNIVNIEKFKDYDRCPQTQEKDVLPWQYFIKDFQSRDIPVNDEAKTLFEVFKEERLDFRPYLIENPVMVQSTDYIDRILEVFRKLHVRMLVVVSPQDGSFQGVITRADLFKYLDL